MPIIFKKAIIGRINRQADKSVGPYTVYYTVLHTVLHCTTQYYTQYYTPPPKGTQYYTVLHSTTHHRPKVHSSTLYYTVLHCTTQYYTQYYTVLHCTTQYYTVLHCTMPSGDQFKVLLHRFTYYIRHYNMYNIFFYFGGTNNRCPTSPSDWHCVAYGEWVNLVMVSAWHLSL